MVPSTQNQTHRRANSSGSIHSNATSADSTSTDSSAIRLLHVTDSILITDMGHAGNYTGTISVATGQPQGQGEIVYDERQQPASAPTNSFRNKAASPNSTDNMPIQQQRHQSNANAIASYRGSWHKGKWHGQGTCAMRNGDLFRGVHVHGERHGPDGLYKWSDGIRSYRGDFAHNQRHGHGTYEWLRNGAVSKYTGSFVKGQRQGHGVYSTPQMEYTGEWMKGKYHGYGVFLVKSTDPKKEFETQYRGHWKQGRKHGYGMETDFEGTVLHEGTWNDDSPVIVESDEYVVPQSPVRESESKSPRPTTPKPIKTQVVNGVKVEDATGAVGVYRGILHNDKPQGVGTMVYDGKSSSNGNNSGHSNNSGKQYECNIQEYEGFWEAGFQHGFGRLQLRNGDYYEGQMAKSLKHGEGIYKWKDGRQYSGTWSHNLRHGRGTLFYPNNDRYEGEFHQGKRQGQGQFVFASGSLYEGQWKAGVYHGRGKLVQDDGKLYQGDFEDGLFHGQGIETDSDGTVLYEGIWTRGEPGEGSPRSEPPSGIAAALTPTKTAKKFMASLIQTQNNNTPLPGNLPTSPPDGTEVSRSSTLTPTSAAKAMLAKVQLPFASLSIVPPPPLDEAAEPLTGEQSSSQQPQEDEAPCKAVVDVRVWDAQNNPGKYTGIIHVVTQHPHGVGRMVYDDKNRIHEGFWVHGNRQGHGRCLFVSPGDFHEGEYFQNLRHGPGKYLWKDGRRYHGDYFRDERHGQGVFRYPNGDLYEGQFNKSERHGQGTFKFQNGTCVYRGEWKRGQYSGTGVLEWRSKQQQHPHRYEGEFENGVFHGRGQEFGKDGTLVREGVWQNGKFVMSEDTTNGKLLFTTQPPPSSPNGKEQLKKAVAINKPLKMDPLAQSEHVSNSSLEMSLSDLAPAHTRRKSDTDVLLSSQAVLELPPNPTPAECPTGVQQDPQNEREEWRSSLDM